MQDGRIHPTRIEEIVKETQEDLEQHIRRVCPTRIRGHARPRDLNDNRDVQYVPRDHNRCRSPERGQCRNAAIGKWVRRGFPVAEPPLRRAKDARRINIAGNDERRIVRHVVARVRRPQAVNRNSLQGCRIAADVAWPGPRPR